MLLILIFETSEMLVIVRSENPNIVAQSLSHVWLFATLWMAAQKGRKCPPPSPGVHSDSYISSRWCHPTTSSSVVPFSSHLQSFSASGSFQWVSFSHQVSKILALQLQHQSFPWIFGVGPLQVGLVGPLAVNIQGWSSPGWLVGPLAVNIQGWSPPGWAGLSPCSEYSGLAPSRMAGWTPSREYSGLAPSRVAGWTPAVQGLWGSSSTTAAKCPSFGAQPPLWSNSHIRA